MDYPILELNNTDTDTESDESNESNESNESENESDLSEIGSLTTIDLNKNSFEVLRVKHNINRPRINYGKYIGALAFDIIWKDNTETREPIQHLIYQIHNGNFIINEFIEEIIQDYKETARKYPSNNRCCLFCYKKVFNGNFMCNKHKNKYGNSI